MFDAIDTSGSGLRAYRIWIDALANNIANINTVTPTSEDAFQAQYVKAQPLPEGRDGVGTGVRTTTLPESSPEGILDYQPDNPLADEDGYVRRPDIDMSQQMGDLILAQRAFQANAAMVDRAKDVYEAAIAIGKGL